MSTSVPAMDWPNLICPDCDTQFKKGDLGAIDKSDYRSFASDFYCLNCGNDIHPEDTLLKYFNESPTKELPGRPSKIGGFASVGTKSLDVGKTEEVGLLGGGSLEIDLKLLSDTDQEAGLDISGLDGQEIEWFPGPILVDDAVVVDLVQASDTEIGFVTSERQSYSSTVTIAYHYHAHSDGVPQPPWATLLSEALESYHRGHILAMYSLLFSSFENLLSREISRTLRATGCTDNSIEEFLNNHWTWKERCKSGVETITGKHLPTEKPDLYENLHNLKMMRDNEIIHIDPGDSIADIDVSELMDGFVTVLDSMLAIHSFCYDERQKW